MTMIRMGRRRRRRCGKSIGGGLAGATVEYVLVELIDELLEIVTQRRLLGVGAQLVQNVESVAQDERLGGERRPRAHQLAQHAHAPLVIAAAASAATVHHARRLQDVEQFDEEIAADRL